MTGKLLLVLAMVLSVNGSELTINRGLLDGVRPEDSARLFYVLKVGGSEREIDVGTARVIEATDASARLRLEEGAKPVREGYQVSLSVPEERVAPAELLALADQRETAGDFEAALLYCNRLEALLPDDLLVRKRRQELERRREDAAFRATELTKLDYYRRAAREFTASGDEDSARTYLERILRVAPDDQEARALVRQWEERRRQAERREATTLFVPPETYAIGVALERASAYNQQPPFQTRLEGFRIDRQVVSEEAYRTARAGAASAPVQAKGSSATAAARPVTGVTYSEAEAYCQAQGRRLPTEFEWEAAARAGIELPDRPEWTASWYQPYPGNPFYEEEYGEKYRVIRGPAAGGKTVIEARYFLDPAKNDARLTFRCAAAADR